MKNFLMILFYFFISPIKRFFRKIKNWIMDQSMTWLILIPSFFTIFFIVLKLFYIPEIRWGIALLPTHLTIWCIAAILFTAYSFCDFIFDNIHYR